MLGVELDDPMGRIVVVERKLDKEVGIDEVLSKTVEAAILMERRGCFVEDDTIESDASLCEDVTPVEVADPIVDVSAEIVSIVLVEVSMLMTDGEEWAREVVLENIELAGGIKEVGVLVKDDRVDAALLLSRLASSEYSTRSASSSLTISALMAEAGSSAASWRRSLMTHVGPAAAQPRRDARGNRIGKAEKYIVDDQ